MICQRCQEQTARVQYTEVIGGRKKVEWLCPQCAREKGITVEISSGAQKPGDEPSPQRPPAGESPELHCPHCGLDLARFRERGRVGCATCYETFEELLEPLLRRVHHATEHAPREGGRDARSRLRRVMDTLRRELHEAVRREEFERAASLRDEIRRYEDETRRLEESHPEGQGGGS